jgi:hypothetical protein
VLSTLRMTEDGNYVADGQKRQEVTPEHEEKRRKIHEKQQERLKQIASGKGLGKVRPARMLYTRQPCANAHMIAMARHDLMCCVVADCMKRHMTNLRASCCLLFQFKSTQAFQFKHAKLFQREE